MTEEQKAAVRTYRNRMLAKLNELHEKYGFHTDIYNEIVMVPMWKYEDEK